MPVPSSISDLNVNPSLNSPQASETVGPSANAYLQALSAFIKQLASGIGYAFTASLNLGGQKITGLANGSVSSSSTDALTAAQVIGLSYKVGEQRLWHGSVANIATVWGTGWQLADGTNGTADCRDCFIVGAGSTYTPGATGGNASINLTAAQMPVHSHGINDPGHGHTISVIDGGHSHGINDPGHGHSSNGTPGIGQGAGGPNSIQQAAGTQPTSANGTGISINAAGTGISANAVNASTGITTQNAGAGAGVDIRPPYYASCILEYTGIGV